MRITFLPILVISTFLFCCKGKDGATGPQGSPGTSSTALGTTSGYVYVTDEFGVHMDNSGVKVTLDGSNPLLSVLSDSLGSFQFKDVPSGTYNLIYTKDGWPANKFYGFPILPGPKPFNNEYTVTLSKSSTTVINNLVLSLDSSSGYKSLKIRAKISPISTQAQPRKVLILYSTDPSVTASNINWSNPNDQGKTRSTTVMAIGDSVTTSLGYGYNNFPYYNSQDQLLVPGEKVYVIAYGLGGPYYYTGINSEGYYFDPELKREVFPSIAPTFSQTVGIILK